MEVEGEFEHRLIVEPNQNRGSAQVGWLVTDIDLVIGKVYKDQCRARIGPDIVRPS